MGPRTAIVVGAGPAGLVAAIHLQRAGLDVTVLEAKGRPGGRAASEHLDGFTLNQGPHALYLGGPAHRTLRALGVDPPGRIPLALLAYGVRDGRAQSLFGPGIARLAARLARTRPADVARLTAEEWVGDDPVARSLAHVASYCDRLDILSADAVVLQMRRATRGVRYVHGGWQSIVDSLAGLTGGAVRTGAAVRALRREDGRWVADTDDGAVAGDVVIVAAGGPERAAKLLGVEIEAGPEAVASVLDLGLERLPRRGRRFATGLDAPRYLSVHSPPARLAEHGVLVGVASYGRAPREELETFADSVQPGWRERATMSRYLPRMVTVTGVPTPELGGLAGRPGVAVPGAPGAFVAGDWVGPEGMLLDAAVASAVAAARAALETRAGVLEAVAA